MSACEYCWAQSSGYNGEVRGISEYSATLRRAEEEGWPCTKNTEEGARLRAGQFWNEETKQDSRVTEPDALTPEEAAVKETVLPGAPLDGERA